MQRSHDPQLDVISFVVRICRDGMGHPSRGEHVQCCIHRVQCQCQIRLRALISRSASRHFQLTIPNPSSKVTANRELSTVNEGFLRTNLFTQFREWNT